jgi:hypothetical protein
MSADDRAEAAEAERDEAQRLASVRSDQIESFADKLHAAEAERGAALDACAALARIVRNEFPGNLSLPEIAETWSDPSDRELDGLRRLEAHAGTHDWEYTTEPVGDLHALCCRTCKEAQAEVARLKARLVEADEIIDDCWHQFAIDIRGKLTPGGLSTLEMVDDYRNERDGTAGGKETA